MICIVCKKEKELLSIIKIDNGERMILSCGHNIVTQTFKEYISYRENFRLIGKRKGFKRPITETWTKYKNSINKLLAKGVTEFSQIDRIKGNYKHKIINNINNEIIHEEDEPLEVHNVKMKIKTAVKNMFEEEKDINQFSSESGKSEWNLAHHLALRLMKEFESYSVDIEIPKLNVENRRPDIIIHRRGKNTDNYLIIEIKRDGTLEENNSDIKKIRTYWLGDPLKYKYGTFINFKNENKTEITMIY